MTSEVRLSAGDKVLVGTKIIEVSPEFADSLENGDIVMGIAKTGQLRRIPSTTQELVSEGVTQALNAFSELRNVPTESINRFFNKAAELLSDDSVFDAIAQANSNDVLSARSRGRSTTRLVLSPKMRGEMVSAFKMWRDLDQARDELLDEIIHDGWKVQQWKAPMGVIGFVFEGRPNVFADATGVLKSGNTVVFRIGSDALETAKAIMANVIEPALSASGLPRHSIVLLDSHEHAAGWALFADSRISLAVARGSGPAVEELGSIAQQSGNNVSLHGTGGAWIIVGEQCDTSHLSQVVEHSLDRKVCNTLNTICVPRKRARELVPIIAEAAHRAARTRGTLPRFHAVNGSEAFLPSGISIEVTRAEKTVTEPQVTTTSIDNLGIEFEWEENPEFHIVIVDTVEEAVEHFNKYSPQFVLSISSTSAIETETVWSQSNAPFFGDGFTRWVDGQFALLRPELGLSNWENGRLFARSGILSGDSAYTVRLRVNQTNPSLHR